MTDEFIFSCLWKLLEDKFRGFPQYSGLKEVVYSREPRWLDCSDGIILNERRFLKQYDPNFCLNRYGGVPDSGFFRRVAHALPDRTIYFHEANDEFTGRKFKMKGKLLGILRGDALAFINDTTKSSSVFVPSSFVNLIVK